MKVNIIERHDDKKAVGIKLPQFKLGETTNRHIGGQVSLLRRIWAFGKRAARPNHHLYRQISGHLDQRGIVAKFQASRTDHRAHLRSDLLRREKTRINHKGGKGHPLWLHLPTPLNKALLPGRVDQENIDVTLQTKEIKKEHLFINGQNMGDHQMTNTAATTQFTEPGERNPNVLPIREDHFIVAALLKASPGQGQIWPADRLQQPAKPATQAPRFNIVDQVGVKGTRHFDIINARPQLLLDLGDELRIDSRGDSNQGAGNSCLVPHHISLQCGGSG